MPGEVMIATSTGWRPLAGGNPENLPVGSGLYIDTYQETY